MDPMTMMMAMQMLGGAGGGASAPAGAPENGHTAISKFMSGAAKGGKEGLPKAEFSPNAFSSFTPQSAQLMNPALKQLGGF